MIQRKSIYDSTQKKATPKGTAIFILTFKLFRTFVFPKTESPTEIGQY